jgi:hypothetical protein
VEWEVYVLNHDLEEERPAAGLRLAQPGACCGTGQG